MIARLTGSMAELMLDSFGNYLCQKLFSFASLDQKERILLAVSFMISSLADCPLVRASVPRQARDTRDSELPVVPGSIQC